jgi:TolA-binding protein
MRALRCDRAWQAEAIEDGRLGGADAASFERHAATCDLCSREIRALAALRRAGARLPVLTSTPLEQRRQRHELLRRANDLAVRTPPTSWRRPLAVTLGLAALTAGLVFWLRSSAPAPVPATRSAADVPSFQIAASPGADWRTVERGATVRLWARSGHIELAVGRLRAGQRFLLELPDGELEVRGTRFVVIADGARTRSVRVVEGSVALRLRGQPALVLTAGDEWSARSAAASATAAPGAGSTPGVADAAPPATPSPARAPSPLPPVTRRVEPVRGSAEKSSRRSAVGSEAVTRSDPPAGRRFTEAVAAFSAGDYGRAELLFVDFERDHAADARVEDSIFLRAVAHSRRGDSRASRAVALEYLRRYPDGLRRAEAERLAK